MFDISKYSDSDLLDCRYNYTFNHCMQDLFDTFDRIDAEDKGLLICELHKLLLKYNPFY